MNCGRCRKQTAQTAILILVALEPLVGTLPLVRADISQTGCCKREGLEPKVEAVIDEFRASVPAISWTGC